MYMKSLRKLYKGLEIEYITPKVIKRGGKFTKKFIQYKEERRKEKQGE